MLGEAKPVTVAEATKAYLAHRKVMVAYETYRNDCKSLRQLAKDFTGSVHALRPQKTIDRLLREGAQPSTVVTHSAVLSGFFRWLAQPYVVRLPKVPRADVRVWGPEERKAIRKAAEKEGALAAVDLGFFAGLRKGEIFGAEWGDVDLPSWTVRVRRQADGRPVKGRRARTALILPGWTHAPGAGRIAPQMSEASQGRLFLHVLRTAGVYEEGVGWHSTRHTYARDFLDAKPDLRLLQASLGHASVTMTERYYDHMLPDRAAELARRAIHGS
jgi:integrase